MTSVILPYKLSRYGDVELRYALRSIEKHLKGYGEIFLLGRAPSWCKNLVEIPTPDIDRNFDKIYQKERAIYEKIRLACYLREATENFLFINDDHFLLQDFDAGKFPTYWSGDLQEAIETAKGGVYINTINNTMEETLNLGHGDLYYDCHTPILYNKKKFLKLEALNWNKQYGYAIKTIYCAMNGIKGEMTADVKFRKPVSAELIRQTISDQKIFSTGGEIAPSMVSVWKELYPERSKYEK